MLMLGVHCLDGDIVINFRIPLCDNVDSWPDFHEILPRVYDSLTRGSCFNPNHLTKIELIRHDDDYEYRVTVIHGMNPEDAMRRLHTVRDILVDQITQGSASVA